MTMPMMDVRPVDMRMGNRFVNVEMFVLFFTLAFDVLMMMMLVMLVGVGMGNRVMAMEVSMGFPVQ